jgi:3-oxoacyl-[acyl-carrier-protein] synthase-3
MGIYLKNISYYLPEKILTNETLIQDFPEWSVKKVASKIGVSKRHIASEDETALDMAVKAAEKLFVEDKNINKNDIDYILFCTQSPDYFLPTSACIIQDKLCLPTSCGALDFNLGCSGYVYGLSLAKGLIAGGIAQNVLLLTAETYTKHLHPKDKGNRTIFGDGASASLISTSGFAEIGDFSLGTDGSGANNLIVKTGAFRHTNKIGDLVIDDGGNPHSSDYLWMDGGEIFNFTLESVPKLVIETLNVNSMLQKDISLFIFHQANKHMLNFLCRKIQIPEDKFYYCLENVGNTVSSTIPIALYEAQNGNSLHGNILLAGFGVGYSWGGVILKVK